MSGTHNLMRTVCCLLAAVTLASCGTRAAAETFEKRETQAPKTEETAAETVTDTEAAAVGAETEPPAEESAEEKSVPNAEGTENGDSSETSEAEAEAKAVETSAEVAEKKPQKLKGSVLTGHSFDCTGFTKKVWSNKKLQKALDKIDGICGEYGGEMSFAYINLDKGTKCLYRDSVMYASCSTVKAPYCMELLTRGADLDEKLTVTEMWDFDHGTVASAGYGREYTVKQLIRYAITESDNTAYLTLVNRFGITGFNEMCARLGAGYALYDGFIFTECSASGLMKQFEEIYRLSQTDGRIEWLTKLMQKTDLETQITAQLADKYPVAHKYGSDASDVFYHDCAICYADSPFVLVIMTTDLTPEVPETDKLFKRLAKQFDIVNEQLYSK